MAKIQAPVIGRSRGSAGGMTFAKNYDKNIMRAKAFEVKNPKTTAQTTQRDFFSQVQEVVASVSEDQLRSLFGDNPKGMSRRNALSKQVAAAYSVSGNTKTVDFSKLQAIGNGEKVSTPIVAFVNGDPDEQIPITRAMLNVEENQNPNLIAIVFNSNENKIVILNSSYTLDDEVSVDDVIFDIKTGLNGFAYVTCAASGENVYLRGFGSFIIKTRAENKRANTSNDTPMAGNTITVTGTAAGSTATLNFANYDFNNLEPGNLEATEDYAGETIVTGGDWTDNGNNTYSAETEAAVEDGQTIYLEITQNGEAIDIVPFAVVVNS